MKCLLFLQSVLLEVLRIPCSCPSSLTEAEAVPAWDVDFEFRLYLSGTAQAQRSFTDAAEICLVPSWPSWHPQPDASYFKYLMLPSLLPHFQPSCFSPEKKKPSRTEENQSVKQEPLSCFRVKLQLCWFFPSMIFLFFFSFPFPDCLSPKFSL